MRTVAIFFSSLVLSSAIYAGGISGGTGTKLEDLELSIQALPKLSLEPESFNRLRMRLHANDGHASMLIGTESIKFKTLAGRIINAEETLEAIEHPTLETFDSK